MLHSAMLHLALCRIRGYVVWYYVIRHYVPFGVMSFGVMSHSALCRIRPYVVQDCVVRRNVAWPNVGVSAHLPPLTPSIRSSGLPMEPMHLLGPGSSPAIFEAVKVIVLALSTDKVAAAEMHQYVMGI